MNEQESMWAGDFGDDYTRRMNGNVWIESNIAFFAEALKKAKGIKTVLELGCNRGLNLAALEYLDQSTIKTGIDINAHSLHELTTMFDDLKLDQPYIHCSPIVNFDTVHTYDLVFTKGVLIHISPEQLSEVYEKMYNLSDKYILIAEYYNPTPVEVKYHNMTGKLYKRDFAGEMLDRYPLKMIDYGFTYKRDKFMQDDLNWFLLSKEK
jgi:spore coat polysaccharide biosynthesis protein SpsF